MRLDGDPVNGIWSVPYRIGIAYATSVSDPYLLYVDPDSAKNISADPDSVRILKQIQALLLTIT